MAEEPKELEQVTRQDVDAVTERLKEWIPTLPDQERLVLGWMLTRAASANDDDAKTYAERTQGGVPVSTLMAEAAGARRGEWLRDGQPHRPSHQNWADQDLGVPLVTASRGR